ncbi:MAG: cytosine deaminase [Alicyclobacillus herbarius]|uniref:cytosine deaminase n=1 Tax=Alicyclobacillus herbarius TaxID=122960 RepID=UPI002357952D|nr:cytosine deaminase [Alicyclobacillus herbarius]MCL6632297.1 cytosine deaminase [Alicyclobacillus herbarius]
MMDLLLRQVRVEGHPDTVDIWVDNGRIERIVPSGTEAPEAERTVHGEGLLALPPFIDPHVHLDSVLTAGQPRWNESGTLFEGIERWSERKATLTEEDVKSRALTALKWMSAHGTLHVRTHVDVTDENLTALKALLQVKEQVKPFINLQIVAFPQEGIFSYDRGKGLELLEEAVKMGVDAVGAIPHYEYTREYGVQSVHACFDLAERYDRMVDIHCDEIDDEQSRFVEVLATCALERGFGARATASHTTAMHSYNGAYTYKLFGLLKKANINFIANPLINITLQGRFDTYPKRRGLTRVKELWQAGINVCLGHDDIMDPWYSLGTGNMLQVAHMAVHAAQMTGRQEVVECVEMVSTRSAVTLQIEDEYGTEVGKPASFVLMDADDKWDLMRRLPPCRYVFSHGRVIAETQPARSVVHWGGPSETVDFRVGRNG